MCFQGKNDIQKKEGNLTREHKYMRKLAKRTLQWRGMTHESSQLDENIISWEYTISISLMPSSHSLVSMGDWFRDSLHAQQYQKFPHVQGPYIKW